jgi:CTP-dependent riboflavin kinase
MFSVKGRIVTGVDDFRRRMTDFSDVFKKAAGEELYPGTLNVRIDRKIKIQPDFTMPGSEIEDRFQDFLFEKCLINGIQGFRIRPSNLQDPRLGGHGDNTLEIASPYFISNAEPDSEVEVTFFKAEQLS